MKITVEFDKIKIEVDETGAANNRTAVMQYGDQNKQIHETIRVMTDQVIKLKESIKD
jgi:hypothetical protein